MKAIFKDLVIIELASVLAGPAVGMFFAELGAKVIKVENPLTKGDLTRQWRLPKELGSSSYSAYYCSINWGKEIRFLNLKEDEDFKILESLIKRADIVISNYSLRVAENLNLTKQKLHAINPGAIIAQIFAFDQSDDKPGFDVLMQAESGFLSMTGQTMGKAAKIPVALIDIIAGHQLKEAILIALLKKAQDGKARYVEVSLYKSAIASLANQASNYLMVGHIPGRMGTQHPNIAPYGDMFYSKDGYEAVLAVGSDQQFQKLSKALKLSTELSLKYQFNADRVKNREELIDLLQSRLGNMTKLEISTLFGDLRIPFGWVLSLDRVFKNDLAKELILESELPDGYPSKCVKTVAFDIQEFDLQKEV